MTMHVNVGGNWQTVSPNIKVGNAWQHVQQGWVKVNGIWQPFYTSALDFAIASSRNNFNLYNAIGLPEADVINVLIYSGVTVGATATNIPAFTLGHAFPGKTINIINKGTIRGAHGAGGAAGNNAGSNGGNGGAGGPAMYLRQASNKVNITNQGNIHGGGGGGGGGGGSRYYYKLRTVETSQSGGHDEGGREITKYTDYDNRSAGGRGGNGGGAAGASPGAKDYQGGATGGVWLYVQGGRGGNGGTSGNNGARGANGVIGNSYTGGTISTVHAKSQGAGGAGGRAGYAIDGNSKANIVAWGDIRGPRVN